MGDIADDHLDRLFNICEFCGGFHDDDYEIEQCELEFRDQFDDSE